MCAIYVYRWVISNCHLTFVTGAAIDLGDVPQFGGIHNKMLIMFEIFNI